MSDAAASTFTQTAERLSQLAGLGAALPPGLRAVASDAAAGKLARPLAELAERLERGEDLAAALPAVAGAAPAHLGALLSAARSPADLSVLLTDWLDLRQQVRGAWSQVLQACLYPTFILGLALVVAALCGWLVAAPLQTVVEEFELTGAPSRMVLWLSLYGPGIAAAVLTVLTVVGLLFYWLCPKSPRDWFLSQLPLFGSAYHWPGVLEFLHIVRLLVARQQELPDALESLGRGLTNGYVAAAAKRMAAQVRSGERLWQAAAAHRAIPASLIPFLRTGEEAGTLEGGLAAAAEMLAMRLELRTRLIQRTLPLVAVLLVAALALWLLRAIFLPLAIMLNGFYGMWGVGTVVAVPVILGGAAGGEELLYLGMLLLPGLAILLASRLAFADHPTESHNFLRQLMRLSGMVLIVIGVLGVFVGIMAAASWSYLAIITVILILLLTRYRRWEHLALLWTLTAAAERSIPLHLAVRAYADERGGDVGARAQTLADALEAGQPLYAACRRARLWLAPDSCAVLAWAGRTGLVAPVLRRTLTDNRLVIFELNRLGEHLWYLAAPALVGAGVLAYISLKIVPVLTKMLDELQAGEPPLPTRMLQEVAMYVESWGVWLPAAALLLFLAIYLLSLYDFSWVARLIPPLRGLARRYYGAQLLRLLAPAVACGYPAIEAMQALAETHPVRDVRRRLARATQQMRAGQAWWPALKDVRLIGAAEAALLAAAQRVGNLPWALDDAADNVLRRETYRMRFWYSVLGPPLILLLAFAVLWIALAVFLPLVQMIEINAEYFPPRPMP